MRTLNVKLTVILVVVVAVVCGSTHLLHSYQLQRGAATFRTQAIFAWNDSPRREKDAMTLMLAYLRIAPADLDAREKLGSWYVETGRFQAASKVLEELVRVMEKQDPPDLPALQRIRKTLVVAAMDQGRCTDAVYHLEILRKELPGDVDVLNRLGKCKISLGREVDIGLVEEAVKDFSAAIQLDPSRVDIYCNKARALRFPPLQRLPEAEKCMADMIAVEVNARLPDAHHVYGMWLEELEKYPRALAEAETVLKLKPDDPRGLYLAAKCELEQRNFEAARKYVARGIKVAPQDFAMYTLMADVLVRSNQRNQAIEVLKSGVETIHSDTSKAQILWHLANLYLDTPTSTEAKLAGAAKGIADAVECIRRMREYRFSRDQLAYLEARVLYANDDWKSAREQFEIVRPKLDDPQLMKYLDCWIGYCYLQQGNPDRAMAAFGRALIFDKYYFKARDGIAQVYIAKGQTKDAVDEYRQAAAGNPFDSDAWLAFARMLVAWNLSLNPGERNWRDVRDALAAAEKLMPTDGRVQLLKAEVYLALGQTTEAEKLVDLLRADAPKSIDFWIAKVNMAARQDRLAEARRLLRDAQARLGDRVRIRLAQAVLDLREHGMEAGPELASLAGNTDAFSPEEKTQLWNGLADNLMEIKEYDRAMQLCERIAREQPHDAMIRYRIFELALITHNARDPVESLARLDRVLEEIDGIAGQGPLWMYGKAVRLMLEARRGRPELLDEAMKAAVQARNMRLSWSRPYVLMGEICRQRGNDEEALENYLRASVTGDRDLQFVRLLLQMLFQRQRFQDAEQVIRRLDSSQTQLTPEIEQKKAEIFALWGNLERALECAEKAYDPKSGDYREHVWHGQVLKLLARRARQEGRRDKLDAIADKAEESLRRACQLAPNAPDCRVALVQLLVDTHQMAKARIAADDAKEMVPLDVAPLTMAYIHEALGEIDKAEQSYQKAVQARPDHPLAIRLLADFYFRHQDFERAAPLVDRLLGGQVHAGEADLISARRMRAMLLCKDYPNFKETMQHFKEAMQLVDLNLQLPLASNVDKRLKVQLMLADRSQVRSPELLELAESLVLNTGAEPEPEDRFVLARLFLARGLWDRCRDQMEKLVNGSQLKASYLTAYIHMLLEHDDLGDVEPYLERLKKISQPGSDFALQAEFMFRRKQWSKVPEFLAAFVGQSQADPPDPLDRSLLAARVLEELGGRLTAPSQKGLSETYFDAARQWYQAYAEKRPGNEMLVAGLEARHGKIDAALEQIEHYGEKSDLRPIVAVVSGVLKRPAATPQQRKRLESLVSVLLEKSKRSTPLLFCLAEVQISFNRLADAEATYREILDKSPRDDLACNNLAMVLALQKTRLDEALKLINETIDRSGPQGSFLDTRALVQIVRHEPDKALGDVEAALADKSTPERLFHRAWAFLEQGNKVKAKESLQAARAAGLEEAVLTETEKATCRQISRLEN